MNESIKLATWNVRGLNENIKKVKETKKSKFLNILKCEKINIAAVSETKIIGTGNEDIGSGYQMYYHGVQSGYDRPRGGIAIVLDSKWNDAIINSPIYKNERIMAMKLDSMSLGWKKNIMVIAIYAPTQHDKSRQTTKFYKDLENLIREEYVTQQESCFLVLMGDFNARIGKEERFGVTGAYGNPKEENKHGEKLIKLASDLRLKITNTYFEDNIDFTFKTNDTNAERLDYIIVDKDLFDIVQQTKILWNADMMNNIWSDHYLVYSIICDPFTAALIQERNPYGIHFYLIRDFSSIFRAGTWTCGSENCPYWDFGRGESN